MLVKVPQSDDNISMRMIEKDKTMKTKRISEGLYRAMIGDLAITIEYRTINKDYRGWQYRIDGETEHEASELYETKKAAMFGAERYLQTR